MERSGPPDLQQRQHRQHHPCHVKIILQNEGQGEGTGQSLRQTLPSLPHVLLHLLQHLLSHQRRVRGRSVEMRGPLHTNHTPGKERRGRAYAALPRQRRAGGTRSTVHRTHKSDPKPHPSISEVLFPTQGTGPHQAVAIGEASHCGEQHVYSSRREPAGRGIPHPSHMVHPGSTGCAHTQAPVPQPCAVVNSDNCPQTHRFSTCTQVGAART